MSSHARAAVSRLLQRVSLRAAIGYGAIAIVVIIAVILIGEDVHRHLRDLETWLGEIGPWGIVVYIALFAALSSVFVPFTPLAMIGGALFGLGWGTGAAVAGALLGACIQYIVARRLLRERVVKWASKKPGLVAVEHAVGERQIRMQTLVRLTPLSPALTSYLFGAAGVRFWGYCAAYVGELPSLLLDVYFGYAGRHYMDRAASDTKGITTHDIVVGAGVVVAIVVMVLVSRTAHKAFQSAIAQGESSPGQNPPSA